MNILEFKKWLETFSQETEEPIQDPKLTTGTLQTYEVPDQINPLLKRKNMKKMKKK